MIMNYSPIGLLVGFGLVLSSPTSLPAAEADSPAARERLVDGIMDNSFLVEEAYNQEEGVIQHIFTGFYGYDRQPGRDDQSYSLNFTQEWPVFSQTHQFSYTIPYHFVRTHGQGDNGLGDLLLNYRFQAYLNQETLMAFAPRASLVLPTGDEDQGLGDDTVGLQFNLPFSTAIGDRWFLHLNAGMTWLPDAATLQDRDAVHYNLGASLNYALTRELHLMLEWVGNWDHVGEPGSARDREFSSLVSPGLRKAFNLASGSQLVLGLAAPIGLTGAGPDYGAFVYLSFEHSLTSNEKK
jgi:hypothetical protein